MSKGWDKRILVSFFTKLILVILLVIISIQSSHAQFSVNNTRKGVYGAKKKYIGRQSGKKNKSYKPTTKKGKAKAKINNKRLKKRKAQRKKRDNYVKRKRKHSLKGKSKSLYGGKHAKKRKKRGSYPKRKSDLGSKVSMSVFSGVVVTGQQEQLNSAGQTENLFANYQPAPSLGLGGEYNYTPNVSFGANIQVLPLSKENLKVRAVSLAVEAKYYLGNKRAKFRPYGLVGLTYSFAGVNQKGFYNVRSLENGKLQPTYSVETEDDILVESIEREEPEIQTGLFSMIGYKAGLGADYQVSANWSIYAELDYHSSFAKNQAEILEFFPAHQSNLNFMTFKVGVRINLMKSKSLY